MQFVSDVASAAVATATFVDCDVALAVLSAIAACQILFVWWRRPSPPAPDRAAVQPGGPALSVDSAKRCAELRAALAQLPPDQQQVIHLRFIEGRRMHEVASSTGLSYEAIRAAQYQALATLAGALKISAERPSGSPPPALD